MEEKIKIDAIQFVRDIRDRQTEIIRGKSNEEIIAFFKKAAEETNEQLQHLEVRKNSSIVM